MTTEIIINLNEERDAYVLSDPKDIIHVNELEQVRQLLEESVKAAQNYENAAKQQGKTEIPFTRKHDTIMLAGVRGSGKTTFMLSILNFIKKGFNGTSQVSFKFEGKESIEVLSIFDPTLIEDKVHVFINIISLIKDRVDVKAKKSNCFVDTEGEGWCNYKGWEKSFKKLADGLPAINGVGHDGFSGDEWADSEFVMDKGISRAHAANHLERNFHDFVRSSLKFLGKSAFLLCFDDIDTNFSKGWPVLEVLHKYLTTPQFITILSGDAHLYSILIRDQQWKNFSDRMLNMEAKTIGELVPFKMTVTHLEEQYFLKLLKSERRVFLNSLYRKGQQEGERNIIVVSENGKRTTLLESYQRMMEKFGVHSISQQLLFYRFLASTPLRTQKQLLYAHSMYMGTNSKKMEENIIDVFWTALAEKKVDVSSLRNIPHHTVPQIISYLFNNKTLIEGYTLSPVYSDHFINSAQFALGTIITERIKSDRSQIIEYWIRVCLTRELAVLMDWSSQEKYKGPSVEDLVEYCAVSNLKSSRYVSRFATAYMRAYLGASKASDSKVSYEKGTWHGTLPLYGFKEKSRNNLPDRMDSVFKYQNFNRVMAYLPLSGATNHKGNSLPIFSFYNLLGVLGEIIYVATNVLDEKDAVKEVAKTLLKNAQYRDYPLPAWALAFSSDDRNSSHLEEDEDGEMEDTGQIPKDFLSELTSWARDESLELCVSPSIMGKIFTRFFYSANKMDEELTSTKTLGEWMHRMIVVFLHAVVLVEATEKLKTTGLNLDQKNPTKKDTIFITNLEKINKSDEKDKLNFSRWFLACPLFKVYMKQSFDVSKKTKNAKEQFFTFIAPLCVDSEKDGSLQTAQINQGTRVYLHTYDLNIELDKVLIKVYEPRQIRNNLINAVSRLPPFDTKSDKCKNDFLTTFRECKITIDDIKRMDKEGSFVEYLKDTMSKEYSRRSLTPKIADQIIKLLGNSEWDL